ncbi:MAG: DNA replication and repair protein RecF [Flavitalea sp.]
MFQLNSISLVHFKNYKQQAFEFGERIVGICGANGVGKTNLLDAIYYLCFTKSYFGRTDNQNVHSGLAGFRVEGHFELDEMAVKAVCIVRETGKKEFLLDDQPYEKFAHHIGKIPCVIIAPDDVRIITEGSEERRRFMDALLSQLDPDYLKRLINYNKILQQRNSYLKSMAESRNIDTSLLDVYDSQLSTDGEFIHEKRNLFLRQWIPEVNIFYRKISGHDDPLEITYESQLLQGPVAELLKRSREKDIYSQRTNTGIHKDDLLMTMKQQPFRNIASQGQRKSLLFALKLAEFSALKENKHFAPLLLLDDVFEKLDEQRMHNLLDWVCMQNEGQLFITDTHPQRINDHFKKLGVPYQLLQL